MVGLVARVPDVRQAQQVRPKIKAYMAEASAQDLSLERIAEIVADLEKSDPVRSVLASLSGAMTSSRYLAAVLKHLLEFWDAGNTPDGGTNKPIASRPQLEQRRSADESVAWDLINKG